MRAMLPILLVLAPASESAQAAEPAVGTRNPEARPFDDKADAAAQIGAALARAKANGHEAILVFGANWCRDSRALAGWFATPRFKAMLDAHYEVVWIDVGMKDRNTDLAKRFGLKGIEGTPTVLIVDSAGMPRNLDSAPAWRDASTRTEDAIFGAFGGVNGPDR
jgi:hypothetical protein